GRDRSRSAGRPVEPVPSPARAGGSGRGGVTLRRPRRIPGHRRRPVAYPERAMAKIVDLLAVGRTTSFEFFPPKTDEAARALEKTIVELQPLAPSFVSVTYGAGGSTRDRTRDIVIGIERDTGLTAMAHLTCVAHRRHQLVDLLEEYKAAGIKNILALGGDPPQGMEDVPSDLEHALELVELV